MTGLKYLASGVLALNGLTTLSYADTPSTTALDGNAAEPRGLPVPVVWNGQEQILVHQAGGDPRHEALMFCGRLGLVGTDLDTCAGEAKVEVEKRIAAAQDPAQAATNREKPLFVIPVTTDADKPPLRLPYYTSQLPREAAESFCSEYVAAPSTDMGASCLESLAAAITAEVEIMAAKSASTGAETSVDGTEDVGASPEAKLLYTMPLKVNGVDAELKVVQGSTPVAMAASFCRQPALGLATGAEEDQESLNACITQVTEICSNVLRVHTARQYASEAEAEAVAAGEAAAAGETGAAAASAGDGQPDLDTQDGAEPASGELFRVPITLGAETFNADLKAGETPGEAAGRFCTTYLPRIHAALTAKGQAVDQEAVEGGCRDLVLNSFKAVLVGLLDKATRDEAALNTTQEVQAQQDLAPSDLMTVPVDPAVAAAAAVTATQAADAPRLAPTEGSGPAVGSW